MMEADDAETNTLLEADDTDAHKISVREEAEGFRLYRQGLRAE